MTFWNVMPRKEKTAAYKTGLIISVFLLIPIIITFLVSVSSGMGLGVFSVIVPSMLLIAALTAVPLMTEQRRLTKSILTGVLALLLIIFFVDRMNGGGQFLFLTIPDNIRTVNTFVSHCNPRNSAAASLVG